MGTFGAASAADKLPASSSPAIAQNGALVLAFIVSTSRDAGFADAALPARQYIGVGQAPHQPFQPRRNIG
jgi:hypothetical protein